MNKALANLQDLKSVFISYCKTLGCEDNYIRVCSNKFDNIETELKDYERLYQLWNCKDNDAMIIQTTKTIHDENNKKLKAFEFLKNNLNIEFEIKDNRCFIILKFDRFYAQQELPKQEFDLLKEVLI